MRERALRELGLAPGWVRRGTAGAGVASTASAADAELVQAVAHVRVPLPDTSSLDLLALRAVIGQCEACGRASGRSNAVAGEGPALVRLMVVDLVPSSGALRDIEFARLFDQLLFSVGLKREAVYFCHALRCDGATPSDSEAASCAPYLQREIELLAPRAVLALGVTAAESIKAHVTSALPHVFAIDHPSAMLKDAGAKRRAWATLRELRDYLSQA